MGIQTVAALALASLASAIPTYSQDHSSQAWGLKDFSSWVAFGDSYTDDSRFGYFYSHNGSAPPVGWVNSANYNSADGGRQWGQYVLQYYKHPLNFYNYAVSGAVCSNNQIKRNVTIGNGQKILYPDVEGYEIPAFIADSQYTEANGTKFMINPPDSTVYSIWIGTNDLGTFVSDSQEPGVTIVDYLDCVYAQLKTLYEHGGRYFVIQNIAPLNLAPLFAPPGVDNPTEILQTSDRMLEQVVETNSLYSYRTAFEAKIGSSFKGAHFALMDMHGLMTRMYTHPELYLNGTAPLNVTGYVQHCSPTNSSMCVNEPSPNSFFWYNTLHPSEQTVRTFAKTFLEVVKGNSQWATYWSS